MTKHFDTRRGSWFMPTWSLAQVPIGAGNILSEVTLSNLSHPKKGLDMKYLLALLFVFGFGFAQHSFNVKFSDAGFDYYGGKNGTKTGYVHLAYEPGTFTVSLSDVASAMKIQYDEMKQAVGSDGKKKPWTKSVLVDYVECYGFSDGTKQGATILHRKSYFAEVMKAYDNALKELGFTSSTEANDTNLHIAIYQNGSDAMRVIFRRQGTDITVRLTEV